MKHKLLALSLMAISFFLALAIVDFAIMHSHYSWSSEWAYPNWLYKYWVGLCLLVTVFAVTVSYALWTFNAPKRFAIAIFATIILLFIGGFLDLFYFIFSYIRGEPYNFEYWSAQYKWFGFWDWPRQIAWTLGCLILIYLVWRWALKR